MNLITQCLASQFEEVDYKQFYRELFPLDSFQYKGEHTKGRYNGILVELTNEKISKRKFKVLRHTVTDDLEKIDEVVDRDNFCLMSPISYAGKTRDSQYARELYALGFDVDGIIIRDNKPLGLHSIIHQFSSQIEWLPVPTYLVSSGTGLHVYYVFEKPILLFPNVLEQLEEMKKALTWKLWHDSNSTLFDKIQYEPVCQGLRVIGTITKKGERVRAFKVGDKVTIEYLNQFVNQNGHVTEFSYKSKLTLEQAKKKYPEWYQKRIIKNEPKGSWQFNRRVYDWWIRKIQGNDGASVGHRYWCLWVLAVTAVKCGISLKELEKDAFSLMDFMNQLGEKTKQPFTEDDVLASFEGYDSCWVTYPIDKMSTRTNISIPRNKRNGRKQAIHLKIARATQEILNLENNTNWRDGNGRPKGSGTKQQLIQQWRQQNPQGKKIDCERDLKLSRPTVLKWW